MSSFVGRCFDLVSLFFDFFHGFFVFVFEVFADLFENIKERGILVFVFGFFVHFGNELNKRVLYFSRSIGKNHHNKIPHQIFPVMKVFGGLVVDN